MRKVVLLCALAVLCLVPTLTSAQDGYFADWFARVDKTKDEQPHWVTPLATTTPRLEEEYRYEQLWQTNAKGITTVDTTLVGRNYAWNNTFQYRVFRKFWPEVELNSTFFQDGKNDGQKQNFVTPGLVMGRFRLWGRVGFTAGRSPRLTFIQATTT